MYGSVAIAEASARGQISDERSYAASDADGLIGVFMHGPVRSFCAFNRLLANAAINSFAAFQCGSEPLAGFLDVFSGHVGGGSHEGAGVFGELVHVITKCLCFFVHIVCVFCSSAFFSGRLSASARWAASGELATFSIEFLPPNGLGTVSLAS